MTTDHVGNITIMKDTERIRLPPQVREKLKTWNGFDICSKLSIEDVPHRVGQVIAYFPVEIVGCTEFSLAVIHAIVAKSEKEAYFIAYNCKSTRNKVFMCNVVEDTQELIVIHSKQLACHLPCNMIETDIGSVVCFQATPIVFKE